ncbi:DNA polymerase alpha/epsilon subunit B [Venturia nashicola]|nr:DNA polymerase alpha/epsilon subunit B [Venturia nashicola]
MNPPKSNLAAANPIPSSSPAFGTPIHAINPRRTAPIPPPQLKPATILPINLPPATLRPVAFRTFTKKHNLTLTSAALNALATFIGRHCGSGWREDGLAEGVLEETAKMWKKENGGVIVEGDGFMLKNILRILDGCMSGGRVLSSKTGLSRQTSFAFSDANTPAGDLAIRPGLNNQQSFGVSRLEVRDADDEDDKLKDPREWVKVIGAFEQPRLVYNAIKKHFDKSTTKASLFPPASQKTELFRQRFHIVHQRILRNKNFQTPSLAGQSPTVKITPIANLLGRSGSAHVLLGLLTTSPTGTLALSDLTGNISLDLENARPFPVDNSGWFCPGMIVLIDGFYTEDNGNETSLGNTGGVGGTIGGKFVGSIIGHPPGEGRSVTLGIQAKGAGEAPTGPAFGWTDFLGVGSERATGSRMRRLERKILGPGSPHTGNSKIAIASEINLDNPATLTAVRIMLQTYSALPASEFPMAMIFMGNFVSHAVMAGAPEAGSIDYKEYFNGLASVFSDFPQLIARSTIVFVPGDKDAWHSSFSAGAATVIPRNAVPEMFTSRLKRVMAEANREVGGSGKGRKEGEIIWTTNPSRLTWFGCQGEMVLFRDNVTERLKRTALIFKHAKTEMEEEVPAPGDIPDEPIHLDEVDTQEDWMDVDFPPSSPPVQPLPAAAPPAPPAPPIPSELDMSSCRLVRTILDQSHLSPFPIATRPLHWDYGSALQLYPWPSALVISDAEAPTFAYNDKGCCVMNPGNLTEGKRGAKWIEYQVLEKRVRVRREGG